MDLFEAHFFVRSRFKTREDLERAVLARVNCEAWARVFTLRSPRPVDTRTMRLRVAELLGKLWRAGWHEHDNLPGGTLAGFWEAFTILPAVTYRFELFEFVLVALRALGMPVTEHRSALESGLKAELDATLAARGYRMEFADTRFDPTAYAPHHHRAMRKIDLPRPMRTRILRESFLGLPPVQANSIVPFRGSLRGKKRHPRQGTRPDPLSRASVTGFSGAPEAGNQGKVT